VFRDRVEAGRRLAARLRDMSWDATDEPVVVLGLPRGGVPVAAEVAVGLDAPLDVCVVRKLGVPGHEELALGAIATGGLRVLNADVVDELGITAATVDAVAAREAAEQDRRERAYRLGRPAVPVAGRRVILVDDGIATGASMRAAIEAMGALGAAATVVAVPVAAPATVVALGALVDDLVCLVEPPSFSAVGTWYEQFTQTTDDEVRAALATARRE